MKDFMQDVFLFPLVIVTIFYFIRIMGNKEMNQSTPIEFAYMVLLLSVGWDLLIQPEASYPHILLMMAALTLSISLIDWVTYRFPRLERLTLGEPKVVIEKGEIKFCF